MHNLVATNLRSKGLASGGSQYDTTQFRGMTEISGGVFGITKREMTDMDLNII